MARLRFSVATEGEIAIAAATAKTVLQILAPTNQDVAIKGFALSFDGTSGSAEPGSYEFVVQTSAGTSLTTATGRHDDNRLVSAAPIQTTSLKGAVGAQTEPSDSGVVTRDGHIHPQTGAEWRYWFDEEVVVARATRLGLRITQPSACNARARFFCEE